VISPWLKRSTSHSVGPIPEIYPTYYSTVVTYWYTGLLNYMVYSCALSASHAATIVWSNRREPTSCWFSVAIHEVRTLKTVVCLLSIWFTSHHKTPWWLLYIILIQVWTNGCTQMIHPCHHVYFIYCMWSKDFLWAWCVLFIHVFSKVYLAINELSWLNLVHVC